MRSTMLGALAVAGLATLAAPRPAVAQTACEGGTTAQEGETLVQIARRCGVTLPALLAANPGVRDDMDFDAGARFRIPPLDTPQPTPQEACGAFYTLRSGDTVAEIAQKCGLTVPLLVAANGPLPTPAGLAAGAKIRIPDLPPEAVGDPETFAAAGEATETESAERMESAGEEAAEAGAEEAEEAEAAEADVERVVEEDVDADTPAGEAPAEPAALVRVEGVLGQGERCRVIRDAEGTEFALVGGIGQTFAPGDRVVVLGAATETDACAVTPALQVRIIYRPR